MRANSPDLNGFRGISSLAALTAVFHGPLRSPPCRFLSLGAGRQKENVNQRRNTMSDLITITGLVATQPRHIVTSEGLPITSFRLASTQRRFDTSAGKWIDGETNWYTVTAFRQLATHTAESVDKGDRLLVVGKLRIREWESDERTGTNIEVEADAIGHDLTWGTGVFTRTPGAVPPSESEEVVAPASVGVTQG
jgi:single-strand DNA-binding protein